jgi:hypothetical protein
MGGAMRAAYVVLLALVLLVIGHWAAGKTAITIQGVVGGVIVMILVAALDHGATEEIAKGIAWIFLAVVALNPDSPITAISNAVNAKTAASAGKSGLTSQQQKVGAGGPNA